MIDTNYLSFNDFESDGVTTEWDISLAGNRPDAEDGTTPYIDAADIKAVQITLAEDDFTSDVYTPLDCAPVDGLPNRFTVTPAAPVGTITRIYRQTQNLYNLVDFQDLSSFTANTMDLAVRQLLFVAQEARDLGMLAMNTNRALCSCSDAPSDACPVLTYAEASAAALDGNAGVTLETDAVGCEILSWEFTKADSMYYELTGEINTNPFGEEMFTIWINGVVAANISSAAVGDLVVFAYQNGTSSETNAVLINLEVLPF